MDPKGPEPRAALARLYLSQGEKPNADEVLKQAKRNFPDGPAGYRLLADFYFTTGDMERATAEYGASTKSTLKIYRSQQELYSLLIQTKRFASGQTRR